MNSLLLYTTFLSVLLFFIIIYLIYVKKQNDNKNNRLNLILNFDKYKDTFTTLAETCYLVIYTDKIFTYSIEGDKLDEKIFNAATMDFVTLFFKYCGNNLLKEFIFLHGSKDTLVFVLVEYFNNKYQNDEIFKMAQENTLDKSINE